MNLTPAAVRATTFPAAPRIRRGYDAGEVDAFVERLAVRLETGDGLTSNDVYHLVLGRARMGGRGYAEPEVDTFLTQVHVELVRLEDAWGHENVPAPATDGPGDDPDDGTQPAALPADGEALAEIAVDEPQGDPGRPAGSC